MINADTLRRHRVLAGHSQRNLAKAAGLGPLGIKRIEDGADAGRLPLAVVVRIAEALTVTVQQLLDETPGRAELPADSTLPDPEPLNYNQAKLLRRIHRGEDIARHLTKADRELIVPSMLKAGLVHTTASGLRCSAGVSTSLAHPGR